MRHRQLMKRNLIKANKKSRMNLLLLKILKMFPVIQMYRLKNAFNQRVIFFTKLSHLKVYIKYINCFQTANERDDESATKNAGNLASSSWSFEKESKRHLSFFSVTVNNKTENYVRCNTCIANPAMVEMYSKNRKPAPITTVEGTRNRRDTVENHLKSQSHEACRKSLLLLLLFLSIKQ